MAPHKQNARKWSSTDALSGQRRQRLTPCNRLSRTKCWYKLAFTLLLIKFVLSGNMLRHEKLMIQYALLTIVRTQPACFELPFKSPHFPSAFRAGCPFFMNQLLQAVTRHTRLHKDRPASPNFILALASKKPSQKNPPVWYRKPPSLPSPTFWSAVVSLGTSYPRRVQCRIPSSHASVGCCSICWFGRHTKSKWYSTKCQ